MPWMRDREFRLLWERLVITQVRGSPQCRGSEYPNVVWASWSGKGEMEKCALAGNHPQGPLHCLKAREGSQRM